jgi:peroxiredoxin
MELSTLPNNLPIPKDDGAADHLEGQLFPDITFIATNNEHVNIQRLSGKTVIYLYPMTGQPDTPLPEGWDEIPGARGCTPQSCSFRDHHAELAALHTRVFGLSTQTTAYQLEAKGRLHLPFELLSDDQCLLKTALKLPTFEVDGMTLYKRITLIIQDGVIIKSFYPVFPPDQNASDVLAWLTHQHAQ